MSDECQSREPTGQLRERTKRFGLRVIQLCVALGDSGVRGVIGRQLVRSGTSVGAQYREGCRARSPAEFISKIESAAQELDETHYWFEMLMDAELVTQTNLAPLMKESDELMAMLVSSAKTAKRRRSESR